MQLWYRSHVVSTELWHADKLSLLFDRAASYQRAIASKTRTAFSDAPESMLTLFYEPSTRTRLSFEAAAQRLGINVLTVADANTSSSAFKGESLEDTARIVSSYADVVVIRHPELGSAARFSRASSVPVINAGDGAGEHPTQSLVDLFTIYQAFGALNGLRVGLCGDLRFGRTIHSLLRLLIGNQCEIVAISPEELALPTEVLAGAPPSSMTFERDLHKALPDLDVLYMTRVQKERFTDPATYERVRNAYELRGQDLSRAKNKLVILHPLPRLSEIATDVDADPRAHYFIQAANGVPVRMALLASILRG